MNRCLESNMLFLLSYGLWLWAPGTSCCFWCNGFAPHMQEGAGAQAMTVVFNGQRPLSVPRQTHTERERKQSEQVSKRHDFWRTAACIGDSRSHRRIHVERSDNQPAHAQLEQGMLSTFSILRADYLCCCPCKDNFSGSVESYLYRH